MKKPTQCILWKDPEIIQREAMKESFELVDTYAQESHWWRYLLILARAGASEDVIAAGILHDTIAKSDW